MMCSAAFFPSRVPVASPPRPRCESDILSSIAAPLPSFTGLAGPRHGLSYTLCQYAQTYGHAKANRASHSP